MTTDERLRVLMIDDDEEDYLLTRDLVVAESRASGITVEWAGSFDAGLAALRDRRHDVYLVDFRLGARSGLDLLREARAAGVTAPMIVLTGRDDRDADLEAMKAGAADYLVKGSIAAPLLERTIRYALERARNAEALDWREAQLRQAQKLEAVGRLAGGIAHDFNNLMTTVNGFAEIVIGSLPEGDPTRRDVEEIRKAGERAASLTRQLLAFSRRQVMDRVRLDLNEAVREVEPMLRPLVGAHVELVFRLAPALPPVLADPLQIQQVLMNLASNARDAMPDGGRLTIETEVVDEVEPPVAAPGGTGRRRAVRLAVVDTGVGMDADTRAHLFEPFFTTKSLGEGTGLGLATVYGIVEQSGGTIRVDSAPRGGSVFAVYLPAALAESSAGPPPPEARGAPEPDRPAAGGETVLLVEDEEQVRKLLAKVLRTRGYAVLDAADGETALEICRAQARPIDLLVTDLVMPGLNGAELATRAAAVLPGLRVLYLSAYPDTTIARHGPLEPGAAFLSKPFTNDAFVRKVRELLGTARRS